MVRSGERIHVIGIAGSGAAGVALLAHHAGARVDGCDLDAPSPYTAPLEAAGVPFVRGHDPAHLVGVDRIAITPALRAVPDLAELQAAQASGMPIITWQALLGELMARPGKIGLAVTGTHGKSTTTALLGHLLIAAGMDPTVEVGAFMADWGATVRSGGGAPFVVEADEFGDNFLNYHPAAAIVTNVEMDHPDFFVDRSAMLARALGARHGALIDGLRSFRGEGRRMELIADTGGVIVYDDYGQRPTEVRAALAAARQKGGDRRLWAVFEPHMYSRTQLFLEE